MCMQQQPRWRLWLAGSVLAAAAATACAPVAESGNAATAPGPAAAAESPRQEQRTMVPPGFGTLKQDEVTVSIRSGAVLVKATPLDEATIRLLAPDTYQRLNALAASRRDEATRAVLREPELFMVSFFSYQPDIAFQPEDVQLFHQARVIRSSAIIPLTSGWGQQRLGQQETQTAIYAFAGPIDYTQSIRVRYGAVESDEWSQIVLRLENERAKVLARVGG
jgi:hypothetical protein